MFEIDDVGVFLGLDVGKAAHHGHGLTPAGKKVDDKPLHNSEPELWAVFDKLMRIADLRRRQEDGLLDAGTDRENHDLVIGSNGGVLAYVTGPDGAVYPTRTASPDEPGLDKVADDLRHFLEMLEHSLTRFIADGETGHL